MQTPGRQELYCIPYSTPHNAHPLGSAQLTSVDECAQNLNKAILTLSHSILFLTRIFAPLVSPAWSGNEWLPHHYTWLPKNVVVIQQILD